MEISTPETVGREVVKGIQCEEEHVYIPRDLHVGLKMQAWVISPHWFVPLRLLIPLNNIWTLISICVLGVSFEPLFLRFFY